MFFLQGVVDSNVLLENICTKMFSLQLQLGVNSYKYCRMGSLPFNLVYAPTNIAGCGRVRTTAGVDPERDAPGQHSVRQEVPPDQV